jgi:hypothetical protein
MDKEFVEKCYKINELEKDFISGWDDYMEWNDLYDIGEEVYKLYCEIKTYISKVNFENTTDYRVIDAVKKVNNDRFISLRFYRDETNEINKNCKKKFSCTYSDNIFSNFMQCKISIEDCYSTIGYFEGLSEVGLIITSTKINNKAIHEYFREIKECFALGRMIPCLIICRALLEVSYFSKLKSWGLARNDEPPSIYSKYDGLMNMISQANLHNRINKKIKDYSIEVNRSVNLILHRKTDGPALIDKEFMLDKIRKTVEVLEFIYSH